MLSFLRLALYQHITYQNKFLKKLSCSVCISLPFQSKSEKKKKNFQSIIYVEVKLILIKIKKNIYKTYQEKKEENAQFTKQ